MAERYSSVDYGGQKYRKNVDYGGQKYGKKSVLKLKQSLEKNDRHELDAGKRCEVIG
jgi:hypothetical protein